MQLLLDLLESQGYRVLTARDGAEAISVLKAELGRIDLVVLDVVMPKVSGLEVVAHLRRTVECLRGLAQMPGGEMRMSQPDPGRWRIKLDRGFPEPFRGFGESQVHEKGRLVRSVEMPGLRPDPAAYVVGQPHPDDCTAAFWIQVEGLAHPLQRGPVRVINLGEGREAHGLTSRHLDRISHSTQPGSVGSNVPKHS